MHLTEIWADICNQQIKIVEHKRGTFVFNLIEKRGPVQKSMSDNRKRWKSSGRLKCQNACEDDGLEMGVDLTGRFLPLFSNLSYKAETFFFPSYTSSFCVCVKAREKKLSETRWITFADERLPVHWLWIWWIKICQSGLRYQNYIQDVVRILLIPHGILMAAGGTSTISPQSLFLSSHSLTGGGVK